MTEKIKNFGQKIAHFGPIEGYDHLGGQKSRSLAIFKKVVLWGLSKLFWGYLGTHPLLWGPAEALLKFDYASSDSLFKI